MTHAELYVMGNQYMLDELKDIAWHRLKAVLLTIGRPLEGSVVIDNITQLGRYVYRETGQMDDEEEPLRNLVSSFVALHYPVFGTSMMGEMIMSTEEGDREFAKDLLAKLTLKVKQFEKVEGERARPGFPFVKPRPGPERHEINCPSCSWQQTHDCGPKCSGYVGGSYSDFNPWYFNHGGVNQ